MKTVLDDKPVVLLAMPVNQTCHGLAALSHYALATRGLVETIPAYSESSVLCYGFNKMWAMALNYARTGAVHYFLLHHADIQITTNGWLDVMVAEMRRVGAAVLSVTQAIKDDSKDTSNAVDIPERSPWTPRRLSIDECDSLPETFCTKDVEKWGSPLLVNSGLMLIDMARPEWLGVREENGSLYFKFTMFDQIVFDVNDELKARFISEDWEFSRRCGKHNLPVYATRKVKCTHHGHNGWENSYV